jgi:hypothetical protein
MDNDKGETVILPTKSIVDKEIIIESGPQPEIPEKKLERITEGIDRQSDVNNKFIRIVTKGVFR